MVFRSYYKLPVTQTSQENCVAHNGTLVPVPGRDVMSQAWYQGGISVFDFTDSAHPKELAFFDRGPISAAVARDGRLLVRLLVQRLRLRDGDRPRLRRLRPDADGCALGERDRSRGRAEVRAVQRAAAAADHVGAELRARAGVPRSGHPDGNGRCGDSGADRQVRRPRREVLAGRQDERRAGAAARAREPARRRRSTQPCSRPCARCPTRRRRGSRSTCRRRRARRRLRSRACRRRRPTSRPPKSRQALRPSSSTRGEGRSRPSPRSNRGR